MYSTYALPPPPVNTVVDKAERVTVRVPAVSYTAAETVVDSWYFVAADAVTILCTREPLANVIFIAETGSVPVKADVGTKAVLVTTDLAGIGIEPLGEACDKRITLRPGIYARVSREGAPPLSPKVTGP